MAISLAKDLASEAPKQSVPSAGTRPLSQPMLPHALVLNTRGYIERIVFQINGCYEKGWFDGCAVMMRRLIETLIIECFEAHSIAHKIKNPKNDDFFFLRDLIEMTLQEPTWNLTRNTKQALSKLKNIGDQSAHSRRFIAHREDIDKVSYDFRTVCQELIFLANLQMMV